MSRIYLIVLVALTTLLSIWMVHAQESVDPYAEVMKSRLAGGGFVMGDPEAGVKLIEFSDFLCESCQNYEPIIAGFIQDYVLTGHAQFEYRIFPVIDPVLSVRSASLVECADTLQSGQFWRAHDLMFEIVSTQGFTEQAVSEFADTLQLDMTALSECAANAGQHAIDAEYGLSLGVSGTPSLFVQYSESKPVPIALALPEHHNAIVNAIRPESTDPVMIENGRYAGLKAFRRADGGFVLGEPGAPVTIVAFEDFLCPHCQNYQTTSDAFIDEFVRTGQAQFEFRFYPVVNPQFSTTFAKAAECVAAQDLARFWDAHDLLFEFANRGSLGDVSGNVANLLNLDREALESCLNRSIQFLVDTQLGQGSLVSGTPAVRARQHEGRLEIIFLRDEPLDRGAPTISQLRAIMEGAWDVTIGPPKRTLLNDRFLADISLISGEPCGPPCWQSIIPGETTISEALDIVQSLEGITVLHADDETFQFAQVDGPLCCQVASEDGQAVTSIILQFSPEMTLGDAVERYGEPLFFRGQPYTETEAILWFYYPDNHIMIQAIVPGIEGNLQETSPLSAAYYLAEREISEGFKNEAFSPWKGYAAYSDYVDG